MHHENIIEIPDKFRDPFSFEEVIALYPSILSVKYPVLDFSRVGFIEPYSMISLLILGKLFLRQRGVTLLMRNIPLQIHQYLTRMDFFKFNYFQVTDDLDERLYLKRKSVSTRLIEIIEIPGKERDSIKVLSEIIGRFRKKARVILKNWFDERTVDYFVTVISEVGQNIFEHSMDSGFFTIQTYTTEKETILKLIIADSGIGIVKSFSKREDLSWETPADCIKMAFTTPISSKRKFGYGLCQVNNIVKKLKGSIHIRSQNASVTALYNRLRDNSSPYVFIKNDLTDFSGTQIAVTLTS